MQLSDTLQLALRALAANKLRAILTMLGIIIGVGAVVALMAIGRGVEQFVTAEFQGIGSSLLFVVSGGPEDQAGPPRANRDKPLTNDDADALADPARVPDALAVASEYLAFGSVEYSREVASAQISGVTQNYQTVRQRFVEAGRFFTETDVRGAARVAVLGQTVVNTLFLDGEDPIDQTVKVNNTPFRVIGTLKSSGGGFFGDQDNLVMIPITTAQQRLFSARTPTGRYLVSVIYVQALSDEVMDSAARQISAVLRERHNIAFRDEDDFTVITQQEVIGAFAEVTGMLTLFLGVIAGISLLVGGIGIMNIMLVSVTERTREIGLRKAVGARRNDVLAQFLVEAISLSVFGGLLGVALGGAIGALVVVLQPDLPVALTWDSVALATGVSAAIGLFFGLYPAWRAAELSPIDALRYE